MIGREWERMEIRERKQERKRRNLGHLSSPLNRKRFNPTARLDSHYTLLYRCTDFTVVQAVHRIKTREPFHTIVFSLTNFPIPMQSKPMRKVHSILSLSIVDPIRSIDKIFSSNFIVKSIERRNISTHSER